LRHRVRARHAAFRERIRRRRKAYLVYRVFIGVVGTAIVLGGLLLLPLPGPGWLIVFLGLGLMATEFHWAHRLLRFTRDTLTAWTQWLKRQSAVVRASIGVGTLALVGALIAAYLVWQGVPDWVPFLD
jgi:uncharacterized protein (TIGR02611 family)